MKRIFLFSLLIFLTVDCRGQNAPKGQEFVKGADIGWLPQMEATGYKFYNDKGKEQDCLQILKDHGINTVRLRTFVNPSNDPRSGHCSKDETIALALRAHKWGMRVMLNFHYSDSWADPGKQRKPEAWEDHDFPKLLDAVYNYSFDVVSSMVKKGVTPGWVQVGNEIPGGMIYPEGSVKNWDKLAQIINKGYDAVKAASPSSTVILHLDKGNDIKRFHGWFDKAKQHGAKYDMIGLSYYPYWQKDSPDYTLSIDDLEKNMNGLVERYGKDVMVVEIGGEDHKADNTYDMLRDVIKRTRAVQGGRGKGVIYWEPQGARSWSKYPLSAWGDDGRPTRAMDAFLE